MPELPEVETTKNDLKETILGHKIVGIDVLWPGIIKNVPIKVFSKAVEGTRINQIERRAKNLIIKLSNNLTLLIHLKMTGHLLVGDKTSSADRVGYWKPGSKETFLDPQNQFIRIIFYLNDNLILAMSDLRKFGYIKLLEERELQEFLSQYGPEPFSKDFQLSYLEKVFSRKRQPIKKVLIDQTVIAGIGNIYADEILWASQIHPKRTAESLKKSEIKSILEQTTKILNLAIQSRGTSTSDFRDTSGKKGSFGNMLSVYRRTGLPCPVCGGPIRRIVLGGRGTHFCSACQKEIE